MSLLGRLTQLLGRKAPDPTADPATMRGIGQAVRQRLIDDPRVEPAGALGGRENGLASAFESRS